LIFNTIFSKKNWAPVSPGWLAGWLAGFDKLSQHRQAQPTGETPGALLQSPAGLRKLSYRLEGFPRRPLAQVKHLCSTHRWFPAGSFTCTIKQLDLKQTELNYYRLLTRKLHQNFVMRTQRAKNTPSSA
jgi:hypothetical protein